MKVTEYDVQVAQSDQYSEYTERERLEIAIYGIVSEIGSLIAVLKKERLGEFGTGSGRRAKAAVSEEIGDIIWYCFSLSQIENKARPVDILAEDIRDLRKELTAKGEPAELFRAALTKTNMESFLKDAKVFPRLKHRTFNDYQRLAFKTARTEENTLLDVCVAVLGQLGAELTRRLVPESERKINTNLPDRPINRILGEVAWHLSAVTTLYGLSLDDVIAANVAKIEWRANRSRPCPLHDSSMPDHERLPREIEIKILTVARGRSRMYYQDKQLGDDLTDNAYEEDGYRFHDVMHLANAAKLGWSPVLRKMLDRKRKSDPKIDEVEDGARARIVEEAVLKTIHSEAQKVAALSGSDGRSSALFTNRGEISFGFIKFVRGLVSGLEVEANAFWEWEDAIFEGYRVYNLLRKYGQGTIRIDLNLREIEFSKHVVLDLKGSVAGFASITLETAGDNAMGQSVVQGFLTARERDQIHPAIRRLIKRRSIRDVGVRSNQTTKRRIERVSRRCRPGSLLETRDHYVPFRYIEGSE